MGNHGHNSLSWCIGRPSLPVDILFLIAVLSIVDCQQPRSAVVLTEEQANQLTSEFTFTDGTLIESQPPAQNPGQEFPQIKRMETPGLLTIGQSFLVKIDTTSDVSGALIYIKPAGKHIVVPGVMGEGQLIFTGKLAANSKLTGGPYGIQVALQRKDGRIGAFTQWLIDLRADTECTRICNEGERCQDESFLRYCSYECNITFASFQSDIALRMKKCTDSFAKDCNMLSLSSCVESVGSTCVPVPGTAEFSNDFCTKAMTCPDQTFESLDKCRSSRNCPCCNANYANLGKTCVIQYNKVCTSYSDFNKFVHSCLGT
jgi:hypothetical protein